MEDKEVVCLGKNYQGTNNNMVDWQSEKIYTTLTLIRPKISKKKNALRFWNRNFISMASERVVSRLEMTRKCDELFTAGDDAMRGEKVTFSLN